MMGFFCRQGRKSSRIRCIPCLHADVERGSSRSGLPPQEDSLTPLGPEAIFSYENENRGKVLHIYKVLAANGTQNLEGKRQYYLGFTVPSTRSAKFQEDKSLSQ
ncbi:hypothetical protein P7K49_035810 [Saguinus oedipus]|uniref:Uncharacterized protein n=1 Tax=Saguinus oedipus TaxID=9490 RepID=A0ABQ9TPD3_SAGOE|nr:hypothetical protein P7K49_035810 [Saguinus oedipus]